MGKKVLIIDDENDMRVYLSTLFRKAEYEAEVAVNGEEGFEIAKSLQPDLITLDVLMPKKSGVKAYRELRMHGTTSSIPIIILTGLAQQEDFFGDDLGDVPKPDAIVDKPIDRDDFLKLAKGIMGD
jgi:CheY-like chemotaxis protein